MTNGFFVIGTDRSVGKTLFCSAFAALLKQRGIIPGVYKPIDTACPIMEIAPQNSTQVGGIPGEVDAHGAQALLSLQKLAGPIPSYILGQTPPSSLGPRDGAPLLAATGRKDLDVAEISPFRFAPDLEPAICARYADVQIQMDELVGTFQSIAFQSDITVVEGCWTLLSPIDQSHSVLDLIKALELPVILLVPSQAGAVGQCLMSAKVLSSWGVELSGVVINRISADLAFDEAALPFQIETHLGDIVRGVIPFFEPDKLLDIDHLQERLRVHVDMDEFLK